MLTFSKRNYKEVVNEIKIKAMSCRVIDRDASVEAFIANHRVEEAQKRVKESNDMMAIARLKMQQVEARIADLLLETV